MAIDLNPDNVRFIIQKAHEFQTDMDDDDAGSSLAAEMGDLDELEMHDGDVDEDLSDDELVATIDDLEPDQQIELVALMWLGRGDYDLAEWSDALRDARDAWNGRTASYLLGTPRLADYLGEGLSLHGYDED